MAKSEMAANVYKINIFANNFATTYARDINNMSILIFSGMRTQIRSFVFSKSLYLCKYKQKQPDIAVKLRLTLFWLIVFFLFLFCLAGPPMVISGRMWSSHPCGFFVKHEI